MKRRGFWIVSVMLLLAAVAISCDDRSEDTSDGSGTEDGTDDGDGDVAASDVIDGGDVGGSVDAHEDSPVETDVTDVIDEPDGVDQVDAPECTSNLIAVAEARVRGSGEPFGTEIEAEPLDHLELSGQNSSASDDATIAEYRWSIVSAPPNYSYVFIPNNRHMQPTLCLGPIGNYVIELVVIDQDGMPSCEASRVEAHAILNSALVVELTWRTPSDEDETDACVDCGSDLDLHFRRPGGAWAYGSPNSDCMAGAGYCLWGDASTDDDPFSPVDDTDGGGPEFIFFQSPALTDGTGTPQEYNEPYQIGVYFHNDHGFSPVLATVRVFLDGSAEPAAVWPSEYDDEQARELVNAGSGTDIGGDFWLVGEVDWTATGGILNEIDQVLTGYP